MKREKREEAAVGEGDARGTRVHAVVCDHAACCPYGRRLAMLMLLMLLLLMLFVKLKLIFDKVHLVTCCLSLCSCTCCA